MIKKARIKFICIIMSILLGFFILLSGVSTMLLRNSTNRSIDHVLNEMVRTLPFVNKENAKPNSFIIKVNSNLVIYETVCVDSDTFDLAEIEAIISKIKIRPITMGRIDDVFYRLESIQNEIYIFALDGTEFLNYLSASILRMCLIFLVIYILLLIIVYLFSFSVFKPIKENFAKQQQFVSNASHELKTPITIISANADVIKKREQSQWIDNIKNQTERLEAIINDMLEMAKIDEGSPKIIKEEFNLSEEIIKTTLPFDALAFEKGKMLELDVIPNLKIKGDKESVKKILYILLDNAVKYASNEGIIKITLTKKNGKNLLSVYNTGSAVPSNQAKKIFERFYRFDNSRSRETGGSGLGLSIAKGIAEANKWKISAISKQNEYMIINLVL